MYTNRQGQSNLNRPRCEVNSSIDGGTLQDFAGRYKKTDHRVISFQAKAAAKIIIPAR